MASLFFRLLLILICNLPDTLTQVIDQSDQNDSVDYDSSLSDDDSAVRLLSGPHKRKSRKEHKSKEKSNLKGNFYQLSSFLFIL